MALSKHKFISAVVGGLLAVVAIVAQVRYKRFEWSSVNSAEVRAYAWDPKVDSKSTSDNVILENMSLRPEGLINKDGALLSPDQTKRLLAAITGEHPAHAFAACYWPHNAFVFYNANGKPIAYVEICFDCVGHRMSLDSKTEFVDLAALAMIFEELKLPTGKRSAAEISKYLDR